MYLTDQNDMESFVPDENFQFSAALGWAVASLAFQASILGNDWEREGNEKLQWLEPVENVVEFSENKVMIREGCK